MEMIAARRRRNGRYAKEYEGGLKEQDKTME
jgi:hypothetical protein